MGQGSGGEGCRGAREQGSGGVGERGRGGDGSRFTFHVDALIAAAERGDADEVRQLLKVLVPEYQTAMEGG